MRKGNVYLADLNPTRGSEQAGTRPVVVFQKDILMTARLGPLSPAAMEQIEAALAFTLDMFAG